MSGGFDMDNAKGWATIAVAVAGMYLLWQGIGAAKKVAGAVGSAVGAAADAVGVAAGASEDAFVGTVGAIGSVAGLPTPDETLTTPGQVRWIIDNAGHYAASQWGTATAYVKATLMAEGSGNNNPPADWVLVRLGFDPAGLSVPKLQDSVVDFVTGGTVYGDGWGLGGSGPSWSDVANGQTSTNPFAWND